MKTAAKILSVLLSVFAVCFCFTQETTPESSSLNQYNLHPQSYYIISQQLQNNTQVLQNIVYVEQIGNNNTINSYQKSNISNIQLRQYGLDNTIINYADAPEISQYFLQFGNQNSIINNLYSPTLINNSVIQLGNNLNLVNYGNNSISNNLKIYMTGNDNSLIIKNFKRLNK